MSAQYTPFFAFASLIFSANSKRVIAGSPHDCGSRGCNSRTRAGVGQVRDADDQGVGERLVGWKWPPKVSESIDTSENSSSTPKAAIKAPVARVSHNSRASVM